MKPSAYVALHWIRGLVALNLKLLSTYPGFFLALVATLGANAPKSLDYCDLRALGSEVNYLSVGNCGNVSKLRGI